MIPVLSFPGTIPFPMEYWSVALGGTYPGGRSHYDVPSEISFSLVPRIISWMITVVCVPVDDSMEYLTVLSFPGTIPISMEYWSGSLGGTLNLGYFLEDGKNYTVLHLHIMLHSCREDMSGYKAHLPK